MRSVSESTYTLWVKLLSLDCQLTSEECLHPLDVVCAYLCDTKAKVASGKSSTAETQLFLDTDIFGIYSRMMTIYQTECHKKVWKEIITDEKFNPFPCAVIDDIFRFRSNTVAYQKFQLIVSSPYDEHIKEKKSVMRLYKMRHEWFDRPFNFTDVIFMDDSVFNESDAMELIRRSHFVSKYVLQTSMLAHITTAKMLKDALSKEWTSGKRTSLEAIAQFETEMLVQLQTANLLTQRGISDGQMLFAKKCIAAIGFSAALVKWSVGNKYCFVVMEKVKTLFREAYSGETAALFAFNMLGAIASIDYSLNSVDRNDWSSALLDVFFTVHRTAKVLLLSAEGFLFFKSYCTDQRREYPVSREEAQKQAAAATEASADNNNNNNRQHAVKKIKTS